MNSLLSRALAAVVTSVAIVSSAVGASDGASSAERTSKAAQEPQIQPSVLRGTFTQLKYLAELNQPLVSSGEFVISAKHGLIWQVQHPIQAQLVVTRQYLVRRSHGHTITRISAEQQPALRVVAAILLAVFQTDMAQLRQYFDITRTRLEGNRWRLTLRPTTAGISKFIQRIHVRGATHIQRIEIHQPSGDHSVIKLDPTQAGPATLTAEEQARFRH